MGVVSHSPDASGSGQLQANPHVADLLLSLGSTPEGW